MRVTQLKNNPMVYSCNVYLIRGNWNAISNVNTLIDVGTDGFILDELEHINTGVGKKKVEQIILTHEHFDHAGGLKKIIERFSPNAIAYSKLQGITTVARDGMEVTLGDSKGIILHTPGHSHDSICIYCEEEKTLFSGDTAVNIKTPGGTYPKEYVEVMERLCALNIEKIYSGHDALVDTNAKDILMNTLENVLKSKII